MTIEQLIANLRTRMTEIDSHITKSAYRELGPDEQDECPTGDDFNLLWDAIQDEIAAAEGRR